MNTSSPSFLSVLLLVFSISCTENGIEQERFTITAQVSGFPDSTWFYLRNLATDAIFDSAIVLNDHFMFEGYLDDPPEQIFMNTSLNQELFYTFLLVGNEDVSIRGDKADFPWNLDISGSKSQDDLNYSQSITKNYDIQRDSLLQAFFKLSTDEKQEIGTEIRNKISKIDSITTELRIDYIKSHPNTHISVIELGYLKNQLPKDTVEKIFENYDSEIKSGKYARVVEVFLREKIAEIGDTYHDFEGLNQSGESVKFSNVKGEYTLLDFTAAYCGPCIQAADELVEINDVYSDSLTVVSFSQDTKKDIWLKSLERDKVAWNSLWDGKGRYSETSIKYGVQGIPTFVLIDPEGLIIDKWTGYGKGSLIARLDENLGPE